MQEGHRAHGRLGRSASCPLTKGKAGALWDVSGPGIPARGKLRPQGHSVELLAQAGVEAGFAIKAYSKTQEPACTVSLRSLSVAKRCPLRTWGSGQDKSVIQAEQWGLDL